MVLCIFFVILLLSKIHEENVWLSQNLGFRKIQRRVRSSSEINLVNFFCEANSVSNQNGLIMVTVLGKVVQSTLTLVGYFFACICRALARPPLLPW